MKTVLFLLLGFKLIDGFKFSSSQNSIFGQVQNFVSQRLMSHEALINVGTPMERPKIGNSIVDVVGGTPMVLFHI
jgi:hypothetical protein